MKRLPLVWYLSVNGCMNVDTGINNSGYPRRMLNGKRISVCRWILERRFERNGLVLPSEIESRHTCDNRRCVNPNHIIPGSLQDNARDRVERNRQPSVAGERNPRAKLTKSDVDRVRQSSESHEALSVQLGVTQTTIRSIRLGKLWK